MTWQENLFNNLLVIAIFLIIGIVAYCKLKKKTLIELFKEIREIMNPQDE